MKLTPVKKLVFTAVCSALCLVLPMAFHSIPNAGQVFLPMHIPVRLCGLICGWQYGALIGAILPLLRFVLFGMPMLYPNALAMSVELCVYGLAVGFIYGMFKKQGLIPVYISLIVSMILGRVAWGGSMTVLLSMRDSAFTASAVLAGAVLNAIPGIILQLLLIPAIMTSLHAAGLQRFRGRLGREDKS